MTTGVWSEGAKREAKKVGGDTVIHEVWEQQEGETKSYKTIPEPKSWGIRSDAREKAAYMHYCENETVDGVEFPARYPFYEHIPENMKLCCDASSNIATR